MTPDGPTDDEIIARLTAAAEESWLDLWQAADALATVPEHSTWDRGDADSSGRIHLPYVTYDDAVFRFTTALIGTIGLVVFDWGRWGGIDRYQGGVGLEGSSVADAVRLATAIIRGERFYEGAIGYSIDNGTFDAIIARLRRWHDLGL
jgi:hypothetical protein